MNKARKQMIQAKNQGLSNLDLLRMKEIARKQAEKMESEAIEKSFLFMLAIPLNVLVNDYWPKTAKKKAPQFIEEVCKLYDSVQEGAVTEEDLLELLKEYAGVNVEAEWLKGKENGSSNKKG